MSQEAHAIGDPERACGRFEPRAFRTIAREEEHGRGHPRGRLEQVDVALLRVETSDGQHHRTAIVARQGRSQSGVGGQAEPAELDAVSDHLQLPLRHSDAATQPHRHAVGDGDEAVHAPGDDPMIQAVPGGGGRLVQQVRGGDHGRNPGQGGAEQPVLAGERRRQVGVEHGRTLGPQQPHELRQRRADVPKSGRAGHLPKLHPEVTSRGHERREPGQIVMQEHRSPRAAIQATQQLQHYPLGAPECVAVRELDDRPDHGETPWRT